MCGSPTHYQWDRLKGPVTNNKNGIIPAGICTWFGSDECMDCQFWTDEIDRLCPEDCTACDLECPCKQVDGKSAYERYIGEALTPPLTG